MTSKKKKKKKKKQFRSPKRKMATIRSPHAPPSGPDPKGIKPGPEQPAQTSPAVKKSTVLSAEELAHLLRSVESVEVNSFRRVNKPDAGIVAEYRVVLKLKDHFIPVLQWWRFSEFRQ
jgi:hypothetical protein